MQHMNNCFYSSYFFCLLLVMQILSNVFCSTEIFSSPTVHQDIPSHFSSHKQFTYVFASKSQVMVTEEWMRKCLLTQVTICFFLNWNLVMGTASTAQQTQPVIMEKDKKAHAEQKTESMLFSVICWCTHSSEGLNSMPATHRPRSAMLLHCSSEKQYVVITKAFSWVLSTVPHVSISSYGKLTAAQLCFLG